MARLAAIDSTQATDFTMTKRTTRQDTNGRSQANYDMKLHPIDEFQRPAHWARRHGLDSSSQSNPRSYEEESHSEPDTPDFSSGSEDEITLAAAELDCEPVSRNPDPSATRRSSRAAAKQYHEYRAHVHPNDADIPGFHRKRLPASQSSNQRRSSTAYSSSRKRKRKTTAQKSRAFASPQQSPEVEADGPLMAYTPRSSPVLTAEQVHELEAYLSLSDLDEVPAKRPARQPSQCQALRLDLAPQQRDDPAPSPTFTSSSGVKSVGSTVVDDTIEEVDGSITLSGVAAAVQPADDSIVLADADKPIATEDNSITLSDILPDPSTTLAELQCSNTTTLLPRSQSFLVATSPVAMVDSSSSYPSSSPFRPTGSDGAFTFPPKFKDMVFAPGKQRHHFDLDASGMSSIERRFRAYASATAEDKENVAEEH